MKFDFFTMLFSLGLVTFMIGIVYSAYIIITKDRRLSLLLFTIGKTAEACGMIGIALRNLIPDYLSIEVSNIVVIWGIVLEVYSVSIFMNKNKRFLFILLTSIGLLGSILFLYFSSNFIHRSIVSALFSGIPTLIVGIDLLIFRYNFRFPILIALSYLFFALSRILWTIPMFQLPPNFNPAELPVVDLFTLIVSSASLVHGVAFLLLLKEVDTHEIFSKSKLISVAFEQSPVGILITDKNGTIEYLNPKLSTLTGFLPEDIIGKKPSVFKSGKVPITVYEDLWGTITSNKVWQGEIINARKNGELYNEHLIIAPLHNLAGDIENFIAIKSDVSKRRQTELLLKQKNIELEALNVGKNKLFSILAHDLRGPLGNSTSLLEIIKMRIDTEDASSHELIDASINSLRSAFFLLENLLQWTRNQLGAIQMQPTKFALPELLHEITDIYRANLTKKRITVNLFIENEDFVYADIDAIRTVLRNLFSNAIKFTPRLGKIDIFTQTDGEYIQISIADTGVGIATDRIVKLFKFHKNESTFGTDGEKGTGLGLVLVKDFIEKNGGQLKIESVPKQGTTFHVRLKKGK